MQPQSVCSGPDDSVVEAGTVVVRVEVAVTVTVVCNVVGIATVVTVVEIVEGWAR